MTFEKHGRIQDFKRYPVRVKIYIQENGGLADISSIN